MSSKSPEQPDFVGRKGPTPDRLGWQPQDGRLPMSRSVSGHRLGGAAAVAVGIPWVFFFGKYLIESIAQTGVSMGLLLVGLLVLAGLMVAVFGISQFLYREETVIDGYSVRWSRRGLSGQRTWQEPLSAYRGVLKDQMYRSRDSAATRSAMVYSLVLDHDDPSKRIMLYEAESTLNLPPDDWDRLWIKFAERFKLPVLQNTSEGQVASSIEDRQTPLNEKEAPGKLRLPDFDPARPGLPPGLSLHREEDLWVITLKPFKALMTGTGLIGAALLLFGLAFSMGWFPDRLAAGVSIAAIGLLALLTVASTARKYRRPDQVGVDENAVWFRTWQRGDWQTSSVSIADILDILLEKQAVRPQLEQVVVRGRSSSLKFGERLPPRARQKLRDLVLVLAAPQAKTPVGGKVRW